MVTCVQIEFNILDNLFKHSLVALFLKLDVLDLKHLFYPICLAVFDETFFIAVSQSFKTRRSIEDVESFEMRVFDGGYFQLVL